MSKLETNTIDNISGSSTLTIGDSNTSTITLKSGATLTNFPANTPAFFSYASASQSYSTSNTKIQLNTESFDTNSNFDTSNYRFTPTTAGKYFIYGQIFIIGPANFYGNALIYKNGGSEVWQGSNNSSTNADFSIQVSAIVSMNGSSDYVELYGRNNSSHSTQQGSQFTYMTGYKLIGA